MPSSVPVVDLVPWFGGDENARAAVAAEVDAALQSVGFFLLTGHGVPAGLRDGVRAEARAFFALPGEAKQRYAVTVGGRGWLPPGVEANGYAEGTPTPPDMKESFAVGADQPTGDPDVDGYWFRPNVYPPEVPGLQPAVVGYLARMRELADELLVVCAAALGLELFFTGYTGHATHHEHQLVPADDSGRPARARAVPDRPAHRLRHGDCPGPRTGPRRPAGVDRAGRVGGRALPPRRPHDQRR
jgi:isopenicillin N synthase-like dioxygenase